MKIAVFGDSYGNARNDKTRTGWPHQLADMLNVSETDLDIYAWSGTSTWWSYQNFLKNYKKYDVIVFCYSSFFRWPVLPERLVGQHWRIPGMPLDEWTEMETYNKMYFDIVDDDLLRFLATGLFSKVNELCKKENKFLINLLAFKRDYEIPYTDFPVYEDANEISWNEKVIRNGKVTTMREVICGIDDGNFGEYDVRICHLSTENNRRLASIFKHAIETRPIGICSDLFPEYEWAEYDDAVTAHYKK